MGFNHSALKYKGYSQVSVKTQNPSIFLPHLVWCLMVPDGCWRAIPHIRILAAERRKQKRTEEQFFPSESASWTASYTRSPHVWSRQLKQVENTVFYLVLPFVLKFVFMAKELGEETWSSTAVPAIPVCAETPLVTGFMFPGGSNPFCLKG